MQPLNKLALSNALHDVGQRDTGTAHGPKKYFVEFAVVLEILGVLVVRFLLPGNAWQTRPTLSKKRQIIWRK